MPGLMWLAGPRYAGRWPFCLTFVSGAGEDQVLAAFGADPGPPGSRATARSALAAAEPAGLPRVLLRPVGGWLAALEQNTPPYGIRPDVLRAASVHGEAVAIYQDIGKLNFMSSRTRPDGRSCPWWSAPRCRRAGPAATWGRLWPLAEELGPGRWRGQRPHQPRGPARTGRGCVRAQPGREADLDRLWRARRSGPSRVHPVAVRRLGSAARPLAGLPGTAGAETGPPMPPVLPRTCGACSPPAEPGRDADRAGMTPAAGTSWRARFCCRYPRPPRPGCRPSMLL